MHQHTGVDVHQGGNRVFYQVAETDIHYPSDGTLLGDGVRVLTGAMKEIAQLAGVAGAKLSDRSRSTRRRLVRVGRVSAIGIYRPPESRHIQAS